MLECKQRVHEKAAPLTVFVPVIGKLNEHFSIRLHLLSFVHCPLSASPVRVRVQGTEAGLQAPSLRPLAGLCVSLSFSLEAPWPTALFSSFPNKVGKVNTFGGRQEEEEGEEKEEEERAAGESCETGLWLSAGRGTCAKQF